jgi:hypothetical protein
VQRANLYVPQSTQISTNRWIFKPQIALTALTNSESSIKHWLVRILQKNKNETAD